MTIFISIAFQFINLGLACGLLLGVLLLLSPVTKRLLTPRQRVLLWMVGWHASVFPYFYRLLSYVRLLPYTLMDWITPRTDGPWLVPAYLPVNYGGPGEYDLAFPGGGSISVQLTDNFCRAVALVWLIGAAAVGLRLYLGSRRLRRRGMQGERLAEGHPFYMISEWTTGIWLCDNIPTSFVSQNLTGGCSIFLQRGLSPERLELVLRHEANHVALRHCLIKAYSTIALVLHWWNPLMWLAYFQSCRDMELDCDRCTLDELDGAQRREYARTLLELASGRPLWDAPMAFGECGAAERVKAAAAWRPSQWWRSVLTWCLTLLVFACMTGGPRSEKLLPADQLLWRRQAQEQWQEMAQEDGEAFIWMQEQELKDRGWMPRDAHIVQGWQQEWDWSIHVWYQLNTTTWRSVTYIWYAPGQFHLFGGSQQVESPNLTDYQRFW